MKRFIRKLLAAALAGVLAVSVMYVLSARFGNLARAGEAMLASEDLSALDVRNLGTLALVLFMLLPIAAVGDMAMVFEADGSAGFPRVAGVLPVPVKKRVLSRYLTIYALFCIGQSYLLETTHSTRLVYGYHHTS